ncbi:DUF982 domain-containing protein [Labrys neptuniae]
MDNILFSRPLEIGSLTIADADQAGSYLLDYWPVDHGEHYESARFACLEAVAGRCHPDDARAAFLRAAEHAGVFVLS